MVTITCVNAPGNPKIHGEILIVTPQHGRETGAIPEDLPIHRFDWPADPDPKRDIAATNGDDAWKIIPRPPDREWVPLDQLIVEAYKVHTEENPKAFNPPGMMVDVRARVITAVVLTHNRPRLLKQTLHALAAQTRPPEEVIVVMNSCGRDGTHEVVRSFNGRFKRYQGTVARHGANVCAARMVAMSYATGDRLIFCDDDNPLDRSALREMDAVMDADRDIGFVYPKITHLDEAGNIKGEREYREGGEWNYHRLTMANYIDTCALVRREAFEEVDGWEAETSPRFEDWRLWLRIAQKGWRGALAPKARLFFRQHEGQRSQQHDPMKSYEAVMKEVLTCSIFTPWAGRHECFDETFRSIAAVMKRHPRLTWTMIDNSNDRGFRGRLYAAIATAGLWPRVRFLRDEHPPIRFIPARGGERIGRNCARLWNTALTQIPEDLIFSVEHDMRVPPDILDHLYPGLIQDVAVAGALYRRSNMIALDVFPSKRRLHARHRFPDGDGTIPLNEWMDIGCIGFGCCLVRRGWLRDQGVVIGRIPNDAGWWPAADTILAARLRELGARTRGILLPNRPLHHHDGGWQ